MSALGEQPFELYHQQEQFLLLALTVTEDGRLPFAELLFSGPKKIGKTWLAAVCMLYVIVVLGGRYAEGYCVANDFEQAASRVSPLALAWSRRRPFWPARPN